MISFHIFRAYFSLSLLYFVFIINEQTLRFFKIKTLIPANATLAWQHRSLFLLRRSLLPQALCDRFTCTITRSSEGTTAQFQQVRQTYSVYWWCLGTLRNRKKSTMKSSTRRICFRFFVKTEEIREWKYKFISKCAHTYFSKQNVCKKPGIYTFIYQVTARNGTRKWSVFNFFMKKIYTCISIFMSWLIFK